jgi:hypothetical protein
MNRTIASLSFLSVCVVLAALLLTRTITPVVSGFVFAAALVVFGGVSRGFRRGGRDDRV